MTDLGSLQIILIFSVILLALILLRSWATSRTMGGIPGSMGWPIIGESLSFVLEFSSPSGIYRDKQLKDNILTLLVAGHDTTTAVLTWPIKFLEENPSILEQLRGEHMEIQEGGNGSSTLTWSQVNKMPYTNKVINETLRIATILPWYSRKAAQDFEIDGYKIKKGWSVNLDVVSIHHDPEIFPDPQKFDPRRFDESLIPFSFLGFGSGQRMCPGINLAKLEISVFIHHLVCRYK